MAVAVPFGHPGMVLANSESARRSSADFARAVLVPLPGEAQTESAPTRTSEFSACPSTSRATSDRLDMWSGPQVHVVYIVASDAPDGGLDTNGVIDCSIRAQNEWMRAQSDGLEWRFDTFLMPDGSEATDVTFVTSSLPSAELNSAGDVERVLNASGLREPNKRYLSYVESNAGGTCGDAFYPLFPGDDGKYAQVYLRSAAGCHSRDFGGPGSPSWVEAIAQQELMHNDGMTPIGAPHSCASGSPPGFAHVCTPLVFTEGLLNLDPERVDVMYPFVSVPLSNKKLDIGHDDYFKHAWPYADLKDSPYLREAGSEKPASSPPAPAPAPSGEPNPTASPSPSPSPSSSPVGEFSRSISIDASKERVRSGGVVRFEGAITGDAVCIAGQSVELQSKGRRTAEFTRRATTVTAEDGSYAFELRVRKTTRFRTAAPVAGSCPQAISRAVLVRTL